jgi:ABC-type nickel/cobalt efflux system permease component RcnA
MAAKIHSLHGNPGAAWGLVGLGLAYGVFHAAGPGHGKALIASYMLANDRSLRRGALMALLAALLQATVAVALVGAAGLILNATASEMNRAADGLALASAAGIAAIGLFLVWRKAAALIAALKQRSERTRALAAAPAFEGVAWRAPARSLSAAAFRAGPPRAILSADGCCVAPDPATLARPFSWRDAAGTVIAAGARPCSGAILVLVFGLAQGLFMAGVAATFAMALGTAATTGALAWIAVFAKSAAVRFAAGEDSGAALIARAVEFAAALAVFAFGILLMFAARGGA